MHHFIFCQKDSYISNRQTTLLKNFGVDKDVSVGAAANMYVFYESASRVSSSNEAINQHVMGFTGVFTGSIFGASGSVSGTVICNS